MTQLRAFSDLARPLAVIASLAAMPLAAQDVGGAGGAGGDGTQPGNAAITRSVQPYIEVNQVLTTQLSPGNDVVTFTQIASGVDVNLQGRNSGISPRCAMNATSATAMTALTQIR